MQATLSKTGTSAADLAEKIFQAKARSRKAARRCRLDKNCWFVEMQRRANEIGRSTERRLIHVWELK